ncbi:PEGA domain-containing protein [Thermococcus barophilus]|uniref:PEGA domain-containing protein n=1 Tax=Thermococcus barophilus (strain DSM 11836 / MP) TaxID=391623 RepID=F0LMV3_THEBM|nr:PEGA domain-containing protein [Thermococcus barophilus]ADT84082.1 hypothetical protein TERMP_01106 [Thermococcus barophilus MP]
MKKRYALAFFLMIVIFANYASAVYVEMWSYDLNSGLRWPEREVSKIVLLGNYALPVACRLFEFDKVWVFNESGLVAEFQLQNPIRVRSQEECNSISFAYRNGTLSVLYGNETWANFTITLNVKNVNPPNLKVSYGGSGIVELPLGQPSGYVEITTEHGDTQRITLPYPVGAVALIKNGIFIGTKGYEYFNRAGTWGEMGPFYAYVGIVYFFKDVPGGYLSIKSNVKAKVFVDGKDKGWAPAVVPLPAGEHDVRVVSFGVPKEYRVEIEENKTTALNVTYQTGYLEVFLPVHAWVKVDGIVIGDSSQRIELPAGNHTVTIFCIGCPDEKYSGIKANFQVAVKAGKTTRLEIAKEMLGIGTPESKNTRKLSYITSIIQIESDNPTMTVTLTQTQPQENRMYSKLITLFAVVILVELGIYLLLRRR